MKRSIVVGIACATLLASGAAYADNDEGAGGASFGIGVDTPLLAIDGAGGTGLPSALSGRFKVGDALGLQGLLAVRRDSQSMGDVDASATNIVFGVRGIFDVLSTMFAADSSVQVGLEGGLIIVNQSVSAGDMDASAMSFALEGGLRGEWFVTDYLSLHTQLGLVIAFLGDDEDMPITNSEGTLIDLLANGDVIGNAGFTFWWQ